MKGQLNTSFFLSLFISIGVTSCSTSFKDNESTDNHKDVSSESVEDDSMEIEEVHNFYVPDDPIERPFDFTEMAQKWWFLTIENESFILYNHWDAQDETIEFSTNPKGERWLEIAYAQDSDSGPISNFNATILEGEGVSKVIGSFTFKGSFDESPRRITFIWNQLKYYASFENLMSETAYYVPEASKDFFYYEETFREED